MMIFLIIGEVYDPQIEGLIYIDKHMSEHIYQLVDIIVVLLL